MSQRSQATAFAPASVGNVGVGFDLLGHALESPGDLITARRESRPGVRMAPVRGLAIDLPREPENNTAGRVALGLLAARNAVHGVALTLHKGIALGSGMGGSAASAVAAAVAVNAILDEPFAHEELLAFALDGESVASGARHADNVAPCLLGGLVLVPPDGKPRRLPVPEGLMCVLVRPHIRLDTRDGRALLRDRYGLAEWVEQAGHLAAFVDACHRGDPQALRGHLVDKVIEPQRKLKIPGFDAARQAAMAAGAIGCSISGSGPSVFAWCEPPQVDGIAAAFAGAFREYNLQYEVVRSQVDAPGAHLVPGDQ